MGGILGKEGSPAKQRWGKLAKTITKFKEPEEQNQHLQIHKGVGQERQSFRFVFYIFFLTCLFTFFFQLCL